MTGSPPPDARINPAAHLGEVLNHIDACLYANVEMCRQLLRFALKAPVGPGEKPTDGLAAATTRLVEAFDAYEAAKRKWAEEQARAAEAAP